VYGLREFWPLDNILTVEDVYINMIMLMLTYLRCSGVAGLGLNVIV